MSSRLSLAALAAVAGFLFVMPAVANEPSVADKVKKDVKEAEEDVSKNAKKLGRKIDDKVCQWVNGKMQCAAKKAGNAIKNTVDEVKDKAND